MTDPYSIPPSIIKEMLPPDGSAEVAHTEASAGDEGPAARAVEVGTLAERGRGGGAVSAVVRIVHRIPVFGDAARSYGCMVALSLAMVPLLTKGIADVLISNSVHPMFKHRYGTTQDRLQRYQAVLFLGWSLKALPSVFSDGVAIGGYRKRWVMLFASLSGALFTLVYALLPASRSSANTAAAMIFMCSFSKATIDVLTDGHYSRLMRNKPTAGPSLVGWIWCLVSVGVVIAAAISGPLNDKRYHLLPIYISSALMLVSGVFFLFNCYEEKSNCEERLEDAQVAKIESLREKSSCGASEPAKKEHDTLLNELEGLAATWVEPQGESPGHFLLSAEALSILNEDYVSPKVYFGGLVEVNSAIIVENWRLFVFSAVMCVTVATFCVVNIYGDVWALLAMAVSSGSVLSAATFYVLPSMIAKANLFSFLQLAFYFKVQQPLRSFYLSPPQCVPGGPYFSYTLYDTVGGTVGSLMAMLAAILFPLLFSRFTYRFTFLCTTLLQVVSGLVDWVVVQRWNRPHVSDTVLYLLGDVLLGPLCYRLNRMPMTILMSRLCPRGSESMVYAVLAGMESLGETLARSAASVLLEKAWPVYAPSHGLCNFSNLRWVLLVGHMAAPLAVLPLVWVLVPDARVCDPIDFDGLVQSEEVRERWVKAVEENERRVTGD